MRALWLVFIVIQSAQASAQPVTNDELFAGYCVGVIQQRMQEAETVIAHINADPALIENCPNKTAPTQCRDQMVEFFRSAQGNMTAELRRYQAYLLAANVSRSSEAMDGALLALSRGKQDQVDCAATSKQHCDQLFRDGQGTAWLECSRRAAPACERSMRCTESNTLPF
jgi:hypothetical protein